MRRLAPPLTLLVTISSSGCDDEEAGLPSAKDSHAHLAGSEGAGRGIRLAPDAFCDGGVHPGFVPGLARLTHSQYDNTIRALLHLDRAPSSSFLADPKVGIFDNDASALFASGRLVRDYRRAAEELAAEITADETDWRAFVPCDPDQGSTCAATFVELFGRRAFRRPLTDEELARYTALFDKGALFYDEGGAFERGVRIVIEAMLQSPNFLYRVEAGSVGARALDGWEMATRLSYLLWGSMPDEELFEAAEAGQLATAEGVAAAARRLLEDPRARDAIDDFHRQWLDLERFGGLTKNPDVYPEWHEGISGALSAEVMRFVRRVVFDLEGSYVDLLTLPETYVDADLAALYGLSGDFGDQMELVELDGDKRAGLLTQIGFLASHAHAVQTSPIHRGVFLQRRILCNPLPDPPGDVDASIPSVGDEIQTTREAVELHTSGPACIACHALINEPGFAFEGYDAIGRERTSENGVPIDSTGAFQIDGQSESFTDAVELSNAIAYSDTGPRCYATQWFRYANMRQETPHDSCTLEGLQAAWEASGYEIKELLVALTQTAAFRHRAAEEDSK